MTQALNDDVEPLPHVWRDKSSLLNVGRCSVQADSRVKKIVFWSPTPLLFSYERGGRESPKRGSLYVFTYFHTATSFLEERKEKKTEKF